ncbi:EscN/YscN/HrcN family type III secretion system ATPase [Dongshaea marina]|uniref:EscN/YscN/HrcN family type III secretion system ATPase n=1 Tax=Dongshaea marina TaxID=2047966 RepID=UPI000D3E86A8|nr:EscN/YscN/HrcN family type III secretion system ATPase [Dongshaea marina]
MRRPELNRVMDELYSNLSQQHWSNDGVRRAGRVNSVGQTLLRAHLPGVGLGELCLVGEDLSAEVVGLQGDEALLSPFAEPVGVSCGQPVWPLGQGHQVPLGNYLIGSVVDGLGQLIEAGDKPVLIQEHRPLMAEAPPPLTRGLINEVLPLGIRSIDGLLTCGKGQRIGIFAAAGGGKSTLLGMMTAGCQADVVVLALVGERGREVREFLDQILGPQARKKTVTVVATSDRPALERLKAAFTATTIAEYFRDQGKNVLLMVDSLTRFARASREIGLAAGEPPAAGGFPPSMFAQLPRLLERAGPAAVGSITGIYTVLVEGDNMNEPVADEVRSILDGHIVLSRRLAEANHYPAIDVLASVSRVMNQISTPEQLKCAGKLRRLLASYRDIELLVRVGEYQRGQDAEADEALDRHQDIQRFLCQQTQELFDFEQVQHEMACSVGGHVRTTLKS